MQHSHRTFVDGCYRCELHKDEIAAMWEDIAKEISVKRQDGMTYVTLAPAEPVYKTFNFGNINVDVSEDGIPLGVEILG